MKYFFLFLAAAHVPASHRMRMGTTAVRCTTTGIARLPVSDADCTARQTRARYLVQLTACASIDDCTCVHSLPFPLTLYFSIIIHYRSVYNPLMIEHSAQLVGATAFLAPNQSVSAHSFGGGETCVFLQTPTTRLPEETVCCHSPLFSQ